MGGEGKFYGNGVGFDEEIFEEGVEFGVKGASFGVIAFEGGVDEGDDFGGDEIGGDADDADGACGDEGEGEGVVAGEDIEGSGESGAECADAFDRAAGFFDGEDIGEGFGEASGEIDADFDAAAAGDGVEDDGNFGGFGDFRVVMEEAFLGGFIVIGSDDEGGGAAEFFGLDGEIDGFGGGIGAGAADDLAASFGEFDGEIDDVEMFVVGEGGGFARGADGDDAGDTGGDLGFDEMSEGVLIDEIVFERGDESGKSSRKHRKGEDKVAEEIWIEKPEGVVGKG